MYVLEVLEWLATGHWRSTKSYHLSLSCNMVVRKNKAGVVCTVLTPLLHSQQAAVVRESCLGVVQSAHAIVEQATFMSADGELQAAARRCSP
jgi:hypothetical protein